MFVCLYIVYNENTCILVHYVASQDTRENKLVRTFGGNCTESVRDAQFCPPSMNYFTFAAAYENGTVQVD